MMRTLKKSSLLKRALLIAMVGVTANIFASEHQNRLSVEGVTQQEWVCDYTRAADDVLYLRCDNMASLMLDPLIMDEEQESSTKFVPIWRKPNNEASAIRLVKAVLCSQGSECRVQMKSLFSADRFANR